MTLFKKNRHSAYQENGPNIHLGQTLKNLTNQGWGWSKPKFDI